MSPPQGLDGQKNNPIPLSHSGEMIKLLKIFSLHALTFPREPRGGETEATAVTPCLLLRSPARRPPGCPGVEQRWHFHHTVFADCIARKGLVLWMCFSRGCHGGGTTSLSNKLQRQKVAKRLRGFIPPPIPFPLPYSPKGV